MAKGILNVGGGVVSVDASGNFTVDTGLIADGASVFNETGVDVDFRIESDDNANMFFVDGGNDRVGIGIATPASALDVRGTVQVGVNDTGHDVKFFGATSGQYMLWDESADELVLAGDSKLSFHDAAGGENIIASADGHLEVNAGTTLDITAPTVDINASTVFNVDGAAVFNEAGADKDFRIENAGDANMFFVEGAGPRIYIRHNASVNIGTAARAIQMHDTASGITNGIGIMHWSGADSSRGNLAFAKSLGSSIGTHTAVTDGRPLGAIEFWGADGTDFGLGAQIQAEAAETFSGTACGGELTFHTVDNTTTTLDERIRITHDGKVGIGTAVPFVQSRVTVQDKGFSIQDNDDVAGYFFNTPYAGTYLNAQGNGGRGMGFCTLSVTQSTTTDLFKAGWGGFAVIGWAGSGHQGMCTLSYGYGGTPTEHYSTAWVGGLTRTWSTQQYMLRISHNASNALTFWCLGFGI